MVTKSLTRIVIGIDLVISSSFPTPRRGRIRLSGCWHSTGPLLPESLGMEGIKQFQWETVGCTMQARNPERGIRACLSEGSQNDTVYSFGLGFARNESEGQGRD